MTNPDNFDQKPETESAGPVLVPAKTRCLTASEFAGLADVPPEVEWFANIQNPRTRKAYQIDIKDFRAFTDIAKPEEIRVVVRSHIIAWRKTLEQRDLAPASICRKLSALSALFNAPLRMQRRPFQPLARGITAGRRQ